MLYILLVLFYCFLVSYGCVRLTFRTCKSYACLISKTAIVTGGDRGIGYSVSLGLASRGCRVILACRRDVEFIKDKIINETGNPNVVAKRLDLLSLSSVRKFAKDINDNEKRLDILINYATIPVYKINKYTEDGLNPVMQANYFGHFLLTHLLADLLKKSAPSKVIFVSSVFSLFHNLCLDNLNPSDNREAVGWEDIQRYCNSKAAIIIGTNVFSEKLRLYRVTVNAVHPGLVNTKLFDAVSLFNSRTNLLYNVFKSCLDFFLFVYSKNDDQGAQPILKVATDKIYESATGHFVWDFTWSPQPACTRNIQFCQSFWRESEKLVKLHKGEKLV